VLEVVGGGINFGGTIYSHKWVVSYHMGPTYICQVGIKVTYAAWASNLS